MIVVDVVVVVVVAAAMPEDVVVLNLALTYEALGVLIRYPETGDGDATARRVFRDFKRQNCCAKILRERENHSGMCKLSVLGKRGRFAKP